jgi:hypothetical protein
MDREPENHFVLQTGRQHNLVVPSQRRRDLGQSGAHEVAEQPRYRAIYSSGVRVSNDHLREFLQKFAEEQSRNLLVYSGDRDPARNAGVGGAKRSYHLLGQAADVILEGYTPRQTVRALYHSALRRRMRVRLLYHLPGATLPEHAHVDLGPAPDMQEQPRGRRPRYVPLRPESFQ